MPAMWEQLKFGKAEITSSSLLTDMCSAEMLSPNPQPIMLFDTDEPESFLLTHSGFRAPDDEVFERIDIDGLQRAKNAIADLREQEEALGVWNSLPAPRWLREFWARIYRD